MRNAFADEVLKVATEDPRVVLLSGDIGNRLFDKYKAAFPSRFVNCGVAEANMTGVAAGLALSGLRPVTYTIAPFCTVRCLEQIRIDVCYHEAPVTIVGVGSGLSYASLGATHHGTDDVALLRAFPNMTILAPADAAEVRGALRAAISSDRPVYIRLGKKGEPDVHSTKPSFTIGRAIPLRDGTDVCLLATGTVVHAACEAAELLGARRISARVVSFHTLKPLDEAELRGSFDRFDLVVTIEEHSVVGGLGGAVAEWLARQDRPRAVLRTIGVPDEFQHEPGHEAEARERLGLTGHGIAAAVEQSLLARPAAGTGSRR